MATADSLTGWLLELTIDGQTASIGANDLGGGFSVTNQSYVGTHIGVGSGGGYGGRVFINTDAPMAENVYLWNNGPVAVDKELSWQWFNYDPLWQSYRIGSEPADINVIATLVSSWGNDVHVLNVNSGSRTVHLERNADFDYNSYRVVVTSSSPVPEPGSLLALGSGFVGLIGFGIRHRR